MITEAIAKVIENQDLPEEMMSGAMEEIMGGQATPTQIAALLIGLRMKGETAKEISAAAQVMRRFATKIYPKAEADEVIVDTCGTGGDGSGTFNVSTATAFVAAGAGLKVAKHGNRAMSSQCGSADVLEKLGASLDLIPDRVEQAIQEVGIGFLFAQKFHGAMKYAAPVRREIGVRTIFNVLGPLTNPAGADVQILGVYHDDLAVRLAMVLGKLGSRAAMVVHGHGGMDELSITGPSRIAQLKDGEVTSFKVTPEDAGLERASIEDIRGGTIDENAKIIRDIFQGETGPRRDIVLLNAAAVFVVADMAPSLSAGVEVAREVIDSGRAGEKLDALINFR